MSQRSLGESGKWAVQQRVRSRQETVNERLKNWGILVTPYRHDFKLHQTVFAAVIVLLQLSFEYNPLFSVMVMMATSGAPPKLWLFHLRWKMSPSSSLSGATVAKIYLPS